MRTLFALIIVLTVVLSLAFYATAWVTPVAKIWFKSGFTDSVEGALSAIPNVDRACIYDDSRRIFVSDVKQLDVDRMLEIAVKDYMPFFWGRTHQRDPHFRVLVDEKTFYWSFHKQAFHLFGGDRWTLVGTSDRLCARYKESPELYTRRGGLAVSEENFCCGR